MTPLAHGIVGFSADILPTSPYAAVHSEFPSMTFTRRVGKIRIALKYDPAGSACATDPTVVKGSLAALSVTRRPEPGFEGEWNTRVRIVSGGPWYGGGGTSIPIVISDSTVVGSAGKRAGRRVPCLSGVGRHPASPQIAHIDRDIQTRGEFIESQIGNRTVRFDEDLIGRASIGVGSVLVVRQDLRGVQLIGVNCEFVNRPKIGV